MDQPIEEAGTERLCKYCGSFKIVEFMYQYFFCTDCKMLLEPKDTLKRQIQSRANGFLDEPKGD